MSSSNTPNTPSTPATALPSEKQMRLLSIIMQSVKGKPDIDWQNVVALSGLKNVNTARETYRQMQKKFGWGSPSGGASGSGSGLTTTPTKVNKRTGKVGTKATPKGRGKKVPEQEDEEDCGEDDSNAAPKGAKGQTQDEGEDVEGI